MHNNHHAFASSAKFSCKWWEFDLGWFYIRLLESLGLAKVKKIAPKPVVNRNKEHIDFDTVSAVISGRLYVMAHYARDVVTRVYKEEKANANTATKKLLRQGRRFITRADFLMDEKARQRLDTLLEQNNTLQVVYEFRQRLQALWQEKSATREGLVQSLQEWCRQAEESGIVALQEFSQTLRRYTLQPA
jgi:stearoyl-CoA desaturase (delta-9 desaturase)